MYFHNHDERTLGVLDDARLRDEWFWNLWSKRLQPYGLLSENDTVGLVVTNAAGSTIRFTVNARDVLHTPFTNRRDALKKLAAHTGLRVADLSANPYTATQPERSGFLLVWRADRIRRVDLPRPPELALWRHGWGRQDDPALLATWGIGAANTVPKRQAATRGQGWQASIEANRAIERHSMQSARDWLAAAGYRHIDDVSTRKSWDYEARRTAAATVRHVEVKGTTATGLECLVTRNEVNAASATPGATILLVVNDIQLQREVDGTIEASGGTMHVFDPWIPSKSELRPEVYRWRPVSGHLSK